MPWRDLLPKMIEEFEKRGDSQTLPASSASQAPNVRKLASGSSFAEAKLTTSEKEALAVLSDSTARPTSMLSQTGIVCDDIDVREMFGRGVPLNEKLGKSNSVGNKRVGAGIAKG